MKLQSLNLVDLVFTRSGKEYLTPSQLVSEIQDELLTRGGRVNLTDLPDYLNVALSHIEIALPKVLVDPSIKIIRGELITDYYLSSLLEEIDDSVSASQTGIDSLADIATRYGLPVDIIRNAIQLHSGHLHATFDPEMMTLTSESALQRQRAQACGMLRGLTSPTMISEAAETHELPVAVTVSALHRMIDTGLLKGVLRGRGPRAIYTPAVYTNAVANTLSADFATNGFLSQGTLSRLHISDVKGFVQDHLSQGILLSECVVSRIWIETLSTSVSDAVASGSWIDAISAMPPGFPEKDIPSVISRIAEAVSKTYLGGESVSADGELDGTFSGGGEKPKGSRTKRRGRKKDEVPREEQPTERQRTGLLYGGRYFVAPIVQTTVTRVVEVEADKRAHERAQVISERMKTVKLTTEVVHSGPKGVDDVRDSSVSSKKGKGKGRRRAGVRDRENMATNTSNKSGNMRENLDLLAPVSVPTLTEMLEIIMAEEAFEEFAVQDYLESGADGGDMISEVVEQTFGETGLVELFHTKSAEAVVELERERATARMNSEKQLLSELSILEVYLRSARTLDQELSRLSFQYLLDTLSTDIVCRVLALVGENCGIGGFNAVEVMRFPDKHDRLERLRVMVSRLPPVFESRALELVRTVAVKVPNETTIEDVFNIYDAVTGSFDLPQRRPIDKKAERAVSENLKAQLAERLNTAIINKPSTDMDMNVRQSLLKASSVLTYAKLHSGAVVDFAAVDVEKFTIFFENLAEAENNLAISQSLGAVRVASLGGKKLEGTQEPMKWDVVLQNLSLLREIIG